MIPCVADPFAEKRTAHITMRKARAESQVLLTIDAGSCHGISKLENVPHVPLANGKARSSSYLPPKLFALTAMLKAKAESQRLLTKPHFAHCPKPKPFAPKNAQGKG